MSARRPNTTATGPVDATLEAAARAKAGGQTLFTVGVKQNTSTPDEEINPGFLRGIASLDEYFFNIEDFSELTDSVQSLSQKLCAGAPGLLDVSHTSSPCAVQFESNLAGQRPPSLMDQYGRRHIDLRC